MRRFKFPKLSHPWAKSKAGFTLVELIVVIAIMGILAGVGTVGYSGYVKASKKGNDKVLVGNIIRAIETGTYSTMFVNDDSFKMGELAYPVGFVSIGTDGTTVVTSNTEVYSATEGPCEWATLDGIIKVENKNKSYICEQQRNIAYTEVTPINSVRYCTAHSPAPVIQDFTGTYVSGWDHVQGSYNDACFGQVTGCRDACGKFELIYTSYPADAKGVTNLDALYTPSAQNSSMCEAAYANQYGIFQEPDISPVENAGDPIYDSIMIAFGDVSGLKLEYDGWVNDDGFNYATFYTSAPALMSSMENLAGLLSVGSKISYSQLGLTQRYEDGEQVLDVVSNTFATTFATEDAWMVQWNNAADATWDSYGFGLAGRENYSAARMGYNTAFASYVESRDSSFAAGGANESHLSKIKEFYSQELLGVGLPGLICTDAFTDSESPLKGKINNDAVFEKLAGYFEDYKGSDACTENGKVLYKTLKTFDDTSDVAGAYADLSGGSIYDYYNSYVDEIAELYNQAQTYAAGGIVIIVTVEKGVVKCQVSPSVADPRPNN